MHILRPYVYISKTHKRLPSARSGTFTEGFRGEIGVRHNGRGPGSSFKGFDIYLVLCVPCVALSMDSHPIRKY